ncbi:MAG: AAA family ATPase [Methylacidiphilales bacterium]|nr:AAA family ATPase [Candidatus Methylacidiphilales bacterium]
MVATYNSSGDFTIDFTPNPDAIPPQNIEIEESVLGGILLDFACIHRIKSRLKPEHFFLNSHRQIYKACLAIAKKGLPTDLLQVTAYLIDKKLLQDIGGKNKLVDLLNSTVSAVNIDALANVLIQKHARRELIKLGNDVTQFAYSSEIELEDVLDLVRRRTETAVSSDASKTQDELIKSRHDSLIEKLKIIYTTTVEPSLKYLKLKYLADETRTSISFLENLYLKALVGTCTQLMDYSDLKESAGSSVRRWLQQGLIPLASTILLAADGGVGKTKFVYSVAKNLIAGHDFGDFLATGEKRKILFYQGDEQPGDMLQSLQMLGYEEGDINQYIRVRFGWSFENMATLIKDLNEFKPDFVLFDSMSFGQRFSSYKEGDSEFARPILECTGLAVEHNCTFLFIHHTNKGGDVRGTTATRNAVSEVWRLRKDSRPEATQYDRILEIDKSRSRSSGKNYRLYFDPDTLGFNFLGEDIQADEDKETGIKKSLLTYFKTHPNVKYTSEELSHFLKISRNSIRRTLNTLSSDGMVSVERKPGKAYLYYLEFTGEKPSGGDHTDCMVTPLITSVDHLQEIDIASDTAKPDQVITENALSNFKSEN